MSGDPHLLRAGVVAELPWWGESALRGTLRIGEDALLLERDDRRGTPISIPLGAILRASIETTLGMMPALEVWHRAGGQERRSRFEFVPDAEGGSEDEGPGLADKVGPGLAREAAQRLEGGFRALTGGLREGKRVMRQAVEGVARQDEYRAWPAAIAEAQTAAARRRPTAASADAAPAPPAAIVPEGVVIPPGDAAATFAWFRQTVVPWLTACGERTRALGVKDMPVIQPQYPLDSPTCRIVVAGEFSRGKSTVINALFGIHGEIALPTGMTPTTPLACAIRVPHVGEDDGATISYRTRRAPQHLGIEEFRAQVRLAEEGDPQVADQARQALHLEEARRVEVRITGAYLQAGVEIEDTPGLNEHEGRSNAALAALGRADLILFVLAADQLLGDLEREVIERVLVQGRHRNVLFLVNFWESIEEEEQRAVLRQRAEALLREFPTPFAGRDADSRSGSPAHIRYISALQAARAQRQRKPAPEESGIPALRVLLRDLLGPQSSALLLRSRAGRALRYLALLRRAVSQAGAAAALEAAGERRGDGKTRGQEAATTAALKLLEGMPGAVQGAIGPAIRAIREQDSEGLLRLAARGGADGPVSEWPAELRRLWATEVRTAAATGAQAAQQAVDLVLAQVRAAFLTRGQPAPALDARVSPPDLGGWPGGPIADSRELLVWAADAVDAAIAAQAEQIRVVLTMELRQASAAPSAAEEPAAEDSATGSRRAEARRRAESLRVLEGDVERLERLLPPCLGQ